MRAAAYNLYLQKKQQSLPKPAAAAVDAPPKLGWADMVEEEEREQQAAAAALPPQHLPWYLAGGVLLSDTVAPAAAAAGNTQPHGFWPDALPPRQQAAAASKSSSSAGKVNMQLSRLADGVRVQVKLHVSYVKLPKLLELAGQPIGAEPDTAVEKSNQSSGEVAEASSTEPEITPAAAAAANLVQQSLLLSMDPDEVKQQLALYDAECEQ